MTVAGIHFRAAGPIGVSAENPIPRPFVSLPSASSDANLIHDGERPDSLSGKQRSSRHGTWNACPMRVVDREAVTSVALIAHGYTARVLPTRLAAVGSRGTRDGVEHRRVAAVASTEVAGRTRRPGQGAAGGSSPFGL